jgi:hypothetical protein
MEEDAPALLVTDRAVDPPAKKQSHKRDVQSLLWALKPLTDLRDSIPLSYVTTFLMVALDEGKGVNAYARAVGTVRSSMSRRLREIGGRAKNGGPGLGLVKVEPHPTESQRRQVFLTKKGRSVSNNIFQRLRGTDAARIE